jgi:hypothetical protein
MPTPLMTARWEARGNEELSRWVGRTADDLRVSVPALQWRLVNLGLVARPAAATVRAVSSRRVIAAGTTPLPFSRRFVERVAQAVEAGRLSVRRAASLLERTVVELAALCEAHGCPLSYDLGG